MPRIRPDLVVEAGGLGPGQHGQAAGVAGRGPHGPLQAGHGLEVVVEDVGPGVEDRSPASAGSPLQSGMSTSTAVPGQRRRMASIVAANADGAAVGEVVAGHGGDHGVGQAEPRDRLGHPVGLVGVEGQRLAGVDQAEPAGPGAAVAVDHERGRAVGPALEDVRAAGLLAHRDQVEVAHGPAQAEELVAHPGRDPQPRRLALGQGQPAVGVDAGLAQPDASRAPGPRRPRRRRRRRRSALARTGPTRERRRSARPAARPRPGGRRARREPNAARRARARTSTTSAIDTSMPSAASDVTGLVGDAARARCGRTTPCPGPR